MAMTEELRGAQLDGNAAAGLLSEVFVRDVTIAQVTCAGCGATGKIGALTLYSQEMGAVLRCPHCESVIVRVVRTTTHVWLDAHGARSISIPHATSIV
jgi:hypothetical protein